MASVKANVKSIAALKAAAAKYEKAIEGHPGLLVCVYPSGKKTFLLRSRIDGKLFRRTLNATNLADARTEWANLRSDLAKFKASDDEVNPFISERTKDELKRKAPTVRLLSEEYITRHAKPKKRTWKADQQMLDNHVLPAWGELKARSITRRQVIALVERIQETSPRQAGKILALVKKMFNFALDREVLEVNPAARLAPPPAVKKDRVLSVDEIKAVWTGLPSLSAEVIRRSVADAFRLQLLTGQRIGEVLKLREEHLDRREKTWLIPAEIAKNKKEHLVPLSDEALRIIDCQTARDGFFFAASGKKGAIRSEVAGHELALAVADLGMAKFTSHDLRRSCATHLARLGVSRSLIESILNHKDNSVTATYDRYDRIQEKRAALESWAAEVLRLTGGQSGRQVVAFRQSAAN